MRTQPHKFYYGFFGGQHTSGDPFDYIKVRPDQDPQQAHKQTKESLQRSFEVNIKDSILHQAAQRFQLSIDNVYCVEVDFINYGNFQMVYLATISLNFGAPLQFTLLINHPHTSTDKVKAEYDNLRRLATIEPRFVVEPFAFYSSGQYGIYAAPYFDQALCIYSDRHDPCGKPWGIFDPHPFYHFESFYPEMRFTVTSTMIAMLVRYYDEEKQLGLAETHLSGDDFMLTQAFRHYAPETVLPNIRLISARDFIHTSLAGYLDLLRTEFQIGTHYKDPAVIEGKIKVNHKSCLPLSIEEIEAGIELGLSLRKKA
ncbi:MAG: hypothetical protein WC863_04845 [Patescibacteria group bacterium]